MSFGDSKFQQLIKELLRWLRSKNEFHDPVIDELDLQVDTQRVPLNLVFENITRIFFHIIWSSNTPDFTKFGGESALTNGLQVIFNEKEVLPFTLKANQDFFKYKFDAEIDQDAVATKNNILNSRLSFFKIVRPNGLDMRDKSKKFFIDVRDNLTSILVNTEIKCIVEGW